MSVRVGIPRALLYYYYYPLWRVFLNELGAETVVSGPTTKRVLNKGVEQAVDEACLPIKLAFGHVQELAEKKVDFIFLPRMVSVHQGEYICPKFLGFPDMVRQNISGLPPVIDSAVNVRRSNKDILKAINQVAEQLGKKHFQGWLAYHKALNEHRRYMDLLAQGRLPQEALEALNGVGVQSPARERTERFTVAVIGHPYNIYDPYISMNIIERLKSMGVRVITADHISEAEVWSGVAVLPKKLFWSLSRRMTGAAYHYIQAPWVDGLIHIAAFACGPDSMTAELIERQIHHTTKKPFLNLTLDEHTGEAGVITRLEAFIDMLRWRRTVVCE